MIDEGFVWDLLRYGVIKADTEIKDMRGIWHRIRVVQYGQALYYTVMRDGEFIECKEV